MELKRYINSRLFADASGIKEAISSHSNSLSTHATVDMKLEEWVVFLRDTVGLKENHCQWQPASIRNGIVYWGKEFAREFVIFHLGDRSFMIYFNNGEPTEAFMTSNTYQWRNYQWQERDIDNIVAKVNTCLDNGIYEAISSRRNSSDFDISAINSGLMYNEFVTVITNLGIETEDLGEIDTYAEAAEIFGKMKETGKKKLWYVTTKFRSLDCIILFDPISSMMYECRFLHKKLIVIVKLEVYNHGKSYECATEEDYDSTIINMGIDDIKKSIKHLI